MTGRAQAWVGCSGWSYPGWRGVVYPPGLPPSQWLGYYAARFSTVEVNSTFYRLPKPETFQAWAARAPVGFRFALKVSGLGTHRLKLRDPERWLAPHLARALLLGDHLGPQLVQLPPRWGRDLERLEGFLAAAPRELQWAVEVRDRSWLSPETFELLGRYGAALCVHDLLPGHPWVRTAGWSYVRFHGPRPEAERYAGQYGPARLARPAATIESWLEDGCPVYAYFNNDVGGAAVRDAQWLARRLASK